VLTLIFKTMKLIQPDTNATDVLYHNLQKERKYVDNPLLSLHRAEELYEISHDLLDANFTEEIKHDFAARYSEMYFASALGHRLRFNLDHPSDKGPDLFIKDLNCWAEITTVRDGNPGSENSVPRTVLGEAASFPERQVILRLTSAFSDKASKIKSYIDEGIIQPQQKVMICISGGWMSEPFPLQPVGSYPQIVKALFPIGDLVLWINRETKEITGREHKYREGVNKITSEGDKTIPTAFFLNPEFSFVSGVLYSYVNAFNSVSLDKLGCDFSFIHNPLAQNKIEPGTIQCGQEYIVSTDADSFTMMPVVDHEQT